MTTLVKKLYFRLLRTQKLGLLVVVILLTGIFVTQYVRAEKEKHVYIFPTTVFEEDDTLAWQNIDKSLVQDLSPEARLLDFGLENSAAIFFGTFQSTTTEEEVSSSTIPTNEIQNESKTESVPVIETTTHSSAPVEPIDRQSVEQVGTGTLPVPVVPTESEINTQPSTTQESLLSAARKMFATRTLLQNAYAQEDSESPASTTPTDHGEDTFAVCLTVGIPCHTLSFAGFGMVGEMTKQPFTQATLKVSFAAKGGGDVGANDRLMIRAFIDGTWQQLESVPLGGEISNQRNTGYLEVPLQSIKSWDQLATTKIAVEYVREAKSDAEVFIDGVWLDVTYQEDVSESANTYVQENVRTELSHADEEARRIERDRLRIDDTHLVQFPYADEYAGQNLLIKVDRASYHPLEQAVIYANITNISDAPEEAHLQFHFRNETGEVTKVERWEHNIPFHESQVKYGTVGYFCSVGWNDATSSPESTTTPNSGFLCADTGEVRQCDSLNEDKTNCLSLNNHVGVSEEISYREGWSEQTLAPGSYTEDQGMLSQLIQKFLSDVPEHAIPDAVIPGQYSKEVISLEPGQTVYLRIQLTTPFNSKGQMFIEAAGESGMFGLKHIDWNASWNAKKDIQIDTENVTGEHLTFPISLDHAGEDFWKGVATSGADIRFVDSETSHELPFSMLEWDYENKHATAWVDFPRYRRATSTISLYYGDHEATHENDLALPMRSENPTARYVVFGDSSQNDQTLLLVALDDHVHVIVGARDQVTMMKGEQLVVGDIVNGETVYADGAITGVVHSVDGGSALVPVAFASEQYVIPKLDENTLVALSSINENADVTVTTSNASSSIGVVAGSIVSAPVAESGAASLHATELVLGTIVSPSLIHTALYPLSAEDMYGVKNGQTKIAAALNATDFVVRCEKGARTNVDGRLALSTTMENICIEGDTQSTEAIRVSEANKPVGVYSLGSDTTGPITYLPRSEMVNMFILPTDTSHVVVVCPSESVSRIAIMSEKGDMLESGTCEGRGGYPGKLVFDADGERFRSGEVVRTIDSTSSPFLMYSNEDGAPGALWKNRLVNVWGMFQSRGSTVHDPKVIFKDEQFVVPGEHRDIDVEENGDNRVHINKLLLNKREFSQREKPTFHFRYTPQTSGIMQSVRGAFGVAPFTVDKVSLVHASIGLIEDVPMKITYGENNEWQVEFEGNGEKMRPGKYTLKVNLSEGGEGYEDSFDFYWGLMAVNYQYSEFVPNDDVHVMLGVLSNTGNTICDAVLKGWVITPQGVEEEFPISSSGKCNGNNVVDVPDYDATYHVSATGTYQVKVIRLDEQGNLLSQVNDSFQVVDKVPYIVERIGPTRIYPVAHYTMKIRVRALEDFSGKISDKVPGDFVFIDRGNADLERVGEDITATWGATLKRGDVVDYTYEFDAPDISPYLYQIGPLSMTQDQGESYTEARAWQIASDAAGKMLIYWDSTSRIPTGWTCLSCSTGAAFYRKFAIGSSTYGLTGGTATSSPTASAVVYPTGNTAVGPNTTTNTTNTQYTHSHTLTPQIARFANYPAYYELLVLQSSSAGEPASIPTGAIVPFDVASSSLPSNWYRYAEMDGRYPLGASSTKVLGGANTHSHTATGTLAAPPESGLRQNGANASSATNVHTHTLTSTSTDVLNNEPPYVEVLYARLTATSSVSNYMITMWDDTPPNEWQVLSSTSTALENYFLKASTTYGGTGGALTHTHRDIIGATTSAPSAALNYGTNNAAQGSGTHTHVVDVTGFSTESNVPPYISVIYAKRLSGISAYTQQDFLFYANANALTPTDPWPVGGNDLSEDDPIDSSQYAVKTQDILRLRMNLLVENSTSTVGRDKFKLQYVESASCATALNWSDVAPTGSSTAIWRGYDNAGVAGSSTLTTNLLASSTVSALYTEQNNSTGTPNQIGIGEVAEYDWVVQALNITAGGNYCFRMVLSDGTPLTTYTNYPSALMNASPSITTLELPYNNEKISTTTPTLQFVATDGEGDDLDYQVQVSTSNLFGSTVYDKDSINDPDLFTNENDGTNKAPFLMGNSVSVSVSPSLTNGNTYWWRARSKDTNGSGAWGVWSSARSMTVDTSVTVSTWFQTTKEQFQSDTFDGAEATQTDQAMLITGSSTGWLYSSAINFSDHTIGTVWGSLKFSDDRTNGTMRYQVEYQDATSGWALIPDADLTSNSTGFGSSPVSLLSVNPDTYPTIRVRITFINSFGTPKLNDFTLEWGYNVTTPTIYLPFDNQIVASTSPYFEFTTTDPQSDRLVYQVSWSTVNTFTSSSTRTSDTNAGFRNISSTTDTSPFISGDRIRYVFQPADALTASTTYFWRVRAKDPSGANNYSFWSDIYSLTPGTWARTGIWYQTVDGQFTTDTLTSMETYGSNRLRVATSTREAMIGYAESASQIPKYRKWNGTAWTNQADALDVGAQIYWTVLRASPLIGEYVLGTLGTDRDVTVQFYNDGAWSNKKRITTSVATYNRRGFDIAYEQVSGKLMAVACDGDADPSYMVWNGTSWSATGTINISSVANCEWIRLASKPNDNELMVLERNTGSRYEAQVWNATTSTWGNAITVGSMTEFAHEGMAVEYENSGQQAVIVTSNANNNNVAWKTWNGSAWSATTTTAVTDDMEWGNLTRGVATDTMVLCYTNNVSSEMALRWDSNLFLGSQTLSTAGVGSSKNNNRTNDCEYQSTTGQLNNILAVYSTNTQAASRMYIYTTRTWSAEGKVPTTTNPVITTSAVVQTERVQDGTILGVFLSTSTNRYDFSYFASSTWSALQTLEANSSVTAAPYSEPFYMAAKNPATQGTIISTQANFADGQAPGWKRFYWTDSKTNGSTLKYQLQYYDASSTWSLVPDADLTGNSAGFSSGPVSISTLDPTTYSTLRLKANATCNLGTCPYLDDWTIEWAQGITLYGTAKLHDLTTATTSGTVAVAVNGVIQAGKTGTIAANGQWQIDNVTAFSGNVITVFVPNAATATRAVAVAKYVNAGDMGGFSLNTNWVTVGSASSTGQTMTLSDLSQYDNSVSASNDIFYDVTAGGDMNTCIAALSAGCSNAGIYVLSGTTFRPNSSVAKIINTYDLRIAGGVKADGNTIKVGGDWRNLGGFDAHTSTVIFNATSTTRSIDQTSAATTTFYNVTFGESGNTGTWSFATAFTATGTVQMSYGTTSPGVGAMTLSGDLTIGSSATFIKGNATTTFSGASSKVLTDNTASKQDLGNVLIDGTTKTLTLGSSVKVTNVTIGADDTFDATAANTITVLGHWINNNVFTARTGTVTMAATTTGRITPGSSSFYNLTINGVAGAFSFTSSAATTSNDLTIATGTLTLPSSTISVGGNFDNSGGTFTSGTSIVRLTSTSAGKNIRTNNSNLYELQLAGSGGGWTFLDTNATTTASTTILAGALTLPTGTLAVGDSFENIAGTYTAGTGIVRMYAASSGHTIRTGGSNLANLQIAGAGAFRFPENNATATQDVSILSGSLAFPYANFGLLGSFTNAATFTAGTSTAIFAAGSGSKTIAPGNSSFSNLTVAGAGTFTITQNATATNAFTINSTGGLTANSGVTVAVGGTFTNGVGGSATTWAGSTLFLNSGTNYSINTKTSGGDVYGTIKIGPNTQIRSWASSASGYTMDNSGSLYSQNHASTSGALNIYGNYTKTSGTDYWSYATDFDGTLLGGSPRQVSVMFGPNATSSYNGAQLQVVGGASATTTIDRETSGNYHVEVSAGTINAQYYQFRNMAQYGLRLVGSTTVTSLRDGDFLLANNGSSMMTIGSTTIDTNPQLQIFSVKFATSSGITSGYNVTEVGTASSYFRFKQHSGNYAGENHDNDPAGNPGYVRWDDSNFVINISGNVYSDAGVTAMAGPTCDNVTNVVRVKVDGAGSFAAPCNPSDGSFTVTGVSFTGDTVMTVYLDTNGGNRAVTVTRSAVSDVSGLKLYKDRVILRHEDSFPITIANLDQYDNGNDSDIPFTATVGSPNTLVVKPDTELWIWASKTFAPGGNVTTQSGGTGNSWDGTMHIDNSAVFTAVGTESHSVGGKFVADAGATFTAASSSFSFTATTTGKSITALTPLTFHNISFNGVGGNWSVNQDIVVQGTFAPAQGTISGASSITVQSTNVTGNGVFAMTGGTFTMANGGTFGGNQDWGFNNLTFSGTGASTTKTASSSVSIAGVLTVSSGHTLFAGTSTEWNLTGAGTPFVVSGTFARETSVFKYSGTGAQTVAAQPYYRLILAPSGAGSPTYTIAAGNLSVLNVCSIGDGTNAVTVNANTNDPIITLYNDYVIRNSGTFIASDSASFSLARDWTNTGTFTHSNGTVTLVATSTGRTISPGNSAFGNLVVDSTTGGWTVAQHATTSGALTLTHAQSFTVASSTTFEVRGTFTNGVGGSATTWTGSTLYLNSGTSYNLNTKILGNDLYDRIDVGANTSVSMWNSAASTTNTNSTGSLYSQDHNQVNGDLYIWGSLTRSTGVDYWDYVTDFDGVSLLGGGERQVNVRFAPNATYTLSGTGQLELIGGALATTTIDRQSTGNYAFNISGGSTTIQFTSFRNADANGVNISGSPTIGAINDSDFELAVTGGESITVTGGAIDANPLKTFYRNRFASSSGVVTGYNVKATGSSGSAWRFNLAYGNMNGESYDSDPGGDPGYLIWDDSAANITISGNVYSDEGKTPIGGPTCDGVTQVVRLKVQGLGSYVSACHAGTGAFSITNVIFNPGDTLSLYLDTNGGARAANISIDPSTNISNMHLYQNRVIVRHEDTSAITIAKMIQYDSDQDTDIPFNANVGAPNTLVLRAGTELVVWDGKTFSPGGNVTLNANATGNSWDGTLHLNPNAQLSDSGNTHTIGGQFLADSSSTVMLGSSLVNFTASTSNRLVVASSTQTFGAVTFNGSGGGWDISGIGTTTGTLSISAGSVILPSTALSLAGSLTVSGGTFDANAGTLNFVSTSTGKTIAAGGSSFNNVNISGTSGVWTMTDANATSTGSITIYRGTLNLLAGTLAVRGDFDNRGGVFTPGSGTVKMTQAGGSATIRTGGSSFNHLNIAGTSTFTIPENNASTTGDVIISAGTTTFPYSTFAVGGSFTNTSVFTASTSTLLMYATSGTKTLNPGSSSLYNLTFSGAGTFQIAGNATTTNNLSINTAGAFTANSGVTVAVGGVFSNLIGGAPTTWTGSTLSLYSGGNYTINTKLLGGDLYDTIRVSSSTQIRSWNSSATTVSTDANSSYYSQNHAGSSGALNIYGNYSKLTGSDYWSYATDFDGTSLGGGSRQVNVRIGPGATTTYQTGATLHMVGSATASTSIDRISTGSYSLLLDGAYLNASYYQLRNMSQYGLKLAGTTTITLMNNGDLELAGTGGALITIASTTIDQNASAQIFNLRFATSSGVNSGANVTRLGTTTNSISFQQHSGNFAGENYDNDGIDGCGSIRWSDSACLFVDQHHYRFRNDDAGEGVPSSEWYNQSWTRRKRVTITNTGTTTLTNVQVKLNVQYDADMQANFNDLRFTDSGGTTTIQHWVQEYINSASSTVWVKLPSLPASGTADVFMYYGNGSANSSGSGTSTFQFFDDFEDNNLTEYSGDTSLFENSTSYNYERSYGLAASAGNTTAQNSSGIAQASAGIGRGTKFRYYQYVNTASPANDESCFMFAVQSPVTLHQNYGVCFELPGQDKISISKNVAYNYRNGGATELATTSVTWSTGWYQTVVDWLSSGRIDVTVYDSTGTFFASTTYTDNTYSTGGVGFTFWGQHGGWDIPTAATYYTSQPTAQFGIEQQDSGASWKVAEDTTLTNQPVSQNVRLRLTVKNSGTPISAQHYQLQVAPKLSAPNCESVVTGNYTNVPTTSGGCGSAAACMTASSQIIDQASTTQLLSVATGFTFAQGQALEDPSNQTGNMSLSTNEVTEVEYNFQMTAFANQAAYCFRTVNGSTPLDNYSKVAELQPLYAPTISNWAFNNNSTIALTEGTGTIIYATGTVSDLNGYTDITAASSTFYRSGVAGARYCTADQNDCYQISTSTCALTLCSGNSCTLSCTANMQYFADPTDAGSTYASQIWDAFVDIWDSSGTHTTASSTQDVYTLRGLSVPSSINYGSVTVGADTGSSNASTSVNNTGNALLNLLLSGTDLTNGSSTIAVSYQKYATTTFTYTSCVFCNSLSSSTQSFNLNVSKPTSTSPFYRDILWGISVPNGTAASTHNGVNTFLAN